MQRAITASPTCRGTLPVFPLTGVLLLPRAALPLNVFEPRYLELVDDALTGNRLIGMIQPIESEETVLQAQTFAGGLRRAHHLLSRDRG